MKSSGRHESPRLLRSRNTVPLTHPRRCDHITCASVVRFVLGGLIYYSIREVIKFCLVTSFSRAGPIPGELGALTELTKLNLSFNNLTGKPFSLVCVRPLFPPRRLDFAMDQATDEQLLL